MARGTIIEARTYCAAAGDAADPSVRAFYLARARAALTDAKRELGEVEILVAAMEREAVRLAEGAK